MIINAVECTVKDPVINQELLRAIEGEFEEMPGMRLTEAQFRRLWALDPNECQRVTLALEKRGSLTRDAGGRYCRPDDLSD